MKIRSLLSVLAAFAAAMGEDTVKPASGDVAEIVRSSLPFIREKGLAWIEDRNCVSCHQVPSMLWSLYRAHDLGFEVNNAELNEKAAWSADWRHWNQSGGRDGVDKVSAGNIDTMAFLLLGRDRRKEALPWATDFRAQLLRNQQPDGSWKPGGQLPLAKRPAREMAEVTTMWVLLALKSLETGEARSDAQKCAEDYLAAAQPGKSTEWHVLRLLLLPKDETLRDELLKLQCADGGWGWLVSEPGDAFGTGLALYALARCESTPAPEPIRRAIHFLRATQQGDGSWPVPSTRARDKNKIAATSSYWGTAWAVIGLLEYESRKLTGINSSTAGR